jgi:hypothetical protein
MPPSTMCVAWRNVCGWPGAPCRLRPCPRSWTSRRRRRAAHPDGKGRGDGVAGRDVAERVSGRGVDGSVVDPRIGDVVPAGCLHGEGLRATVGHHDGAGGRDVAVRPGVRGDDSGVDGERGTNGMARRDFVERDGRHRPDGGAVDQHVGDAVAGGRRDDERLRPAVGDRHVTRRRDVTVRPGARRDGDALRERDDHRGFERHRVTRASPAGPGRTERDRQRPDVAGAHRPGDVDAVPQAR